MVRDMEVFRSFKPAALAVAFCLLLAIFSCKNNVDQPSPKNSGVSITCDYSGDSIRIGESLDLTVQVKDVQPNLYTCKWSVTKGLARTTRSDLRVYTVTPKQAGKLEVGVEITMVSNPSDVRSAAFEINVRALTDSDTGKVDISALLSDSVMSLVREALRTGGEWKSDKGYVTVDSNGVLTVSKEADAEDEILNGSVTAQIWAVNGEGQEVEGSRIFVEIPKYVPVESVDIQYSNGTAVPQSGLVLVSGKETPLKAVVSPEGASGRIVTWKLIKDGNDEPSDVASVSADGRLKGLLLGGAAKLVAMAGWNESFSSKSLSVRVNANKIFIPAPVEGQANHTMTISTGSSQNISFDADEGVSISNIVSGDDTIVDADIESSSISVDGDGNDGKLVLVTLSLNYGAQTASETIELIVGREIKPQTISAGNMEVHLGRAVKPNIICTPENITFKDITYSVADDKDKILEFSQDGKTLQVKKAAASGKTATVRASLTRHPEVYCEFDVTSVNVPVNKVTIKNADDSEVGAQPISIKVGEQVSFVAVVEPDDATDRTVKWSVEKTSDDESIRAVTVTQDGLVTGGMLGGKAKVRVSAMDGSGKSDEVAFAISAETVPMGNKSIGASGEEEMPPVSTGSVTSTVIEPPEGKTITNITSSDGGAVSVLVEDGKGKLTISHDGNDGKLVVVTIEYDNDSEHCDRLELVVGEEIPLQSFSLNATSKEFILGDDGDNTIQLATANPEPAGATFKDSKYFKWTVDEGKENVVSVNGTGLVEVKGLGETKVTAVSARYSEVSASIDITVRNPRITFMEWDADDQTWKAQENTASAVWNSKLTDVIGSKTGSGTIWKNGDDEEVPYDFVRWTLVSGEGANPSTLDGAALADTDLLAGDKTLYAVYSLRKMKVKLMEWKNGAWKQFGDVTEQVWGTDFVPPEDGPSSETVTYDSKNYGFTGWAEFSSKPDSVADAKPQDDYFMGPVKKDLTLYACYAGDVTVLFRYWSGSGWSDFARYVQKWGSEYKPTGGVPGSINYGGVKYFQKWVRSTRAPGNPLVSGAEYSSDKVTTDITLYASYGAGYNQSAFMANVPEVEDFKMQSKKVGVSKFKISKYEVTRELWMMVQEWLAADPQNNKKKITQESYSVQVGGYNQTRWRSKLENVDDTEVQNKSRKKRYSGIYSKNDATNVFTYPWGAGTEEPAVKMYEKTPEKPNLFPATGMTWYQACEFCNAMSEMNGLKPLYYVDKTGGGRRYGGFKSGDIIKCDWNGDVDVDYDWFRVIFTDKSSNNVKQSFSNETSDTNDYQTGKSYKPSGVPDTGTEYLNYNFSSNFGDYFETPIRYEKTDNCDFILIDSQGKRVPVKDEGGVYYQVDEDGEYVLNGVNKISVTGEKIMVRKNDSAKNFTWLETAKAGYRLPTETEWEYACSGGEYKEADNPSSGAKYTYSGIDTVSMAGWFIIPTSYEASNSSEGKPHEVGIKGPVYSVEVQGINAISYLGNGFGIFDMTGNAAEWCWDRHNGAYDGSGKDYKGSTSGTDRIARGGSFVDNYTDCASAKRQSFSPNSSAYGRGLRLAQSVIEDE